MLTAVSLFAGIGGIDLALSRARVRVVAAVELDPAARGVLADRFPDTTLFNDVTEVTGDQLRAAGLVPDRGIITAGWPCQDFSVAGRRLGLGGARSGLWWHVVRLLAETRPRWFVGENVPGILSAVCACPGTREHDGCAEPHHVAGGQCGPGRCMELHGGAMGSVLGSLAQLGYGFAYRVLDAQYLGVPQQRPRVVFVGCTGGRAAPVQVLLEPEGGEGHPAASGAPGPEAAGVAALSASDGGADDDDATGGRLIVGALQAQGGNGRGHRLDAESAAGGHLVATAVTAPEGKGPDSDATTTLVPVDAAQITSRHNRANPQPGAPAATLAAGGQPSVAYALRGDPGGTGQAHNTSYVAHALTSEGADASEDGTGRGTPLVPVAFNPQSGGSKAMIGYSDTPTALTANQVAGVHVQGAVRRLTPTECERLQGLPDGWTATSAGRAQSDSARYRQLGNSVAVPVFEWVLGRLAAADREVG